MFTFKKPAFAILNVLFMVILLTFISPYVLDFGEESLDELFEAVYDYADNSSHDEFRTFIDAKLCVRTESELVRDFSSELADFCESDEKSAICAQKENAKYEYQKQICDVYRTPEFEDFCDSVSKTKSERDLDQLCSLYHDSSLSEKEFFMGYIEGKLTVIEDDVFEHGTVHDAALESLHVPNFLRFENYLVWQRILLIVIITSILYVLAGNVRTLTHKIGHVFVETGGFLIVYRLIIELLTLLFGIDTSYLFEVLILSDGSITFATIFGEVFLTLFLLMHQIFFKEGYWMIAIAFVLVGFALYVPWFIRHLQAKRKGKKDEIEAV